MRAVSSLGLSCLAEMRIVSWSNLSIYDTKKIFICHKLVGPVVGTDLHIPYVVGQGLVVAPFSYPPASTWSSIEMIKIQSNADTINKQW